MSALSALERLKRLVVDRTGHHYYVDKDKLLFERGRERMLAGGAASLDAYVDVLESGDTQEWRALEDAITVGETYFFRYPDHFGMLREQILPRLILARQDVKALRIWSVGCSNGSEPYSIAIVLRELLGQEIDRWRISLIGGDISEKALSAARAGRFNAWALRTMGAEDREKYFDRDSSAWILKREFRAMVRFERQNILDLLSPVPPLEWTGFDLVLCRNVLIYFSPELAIQVSQALAGTLAPDGALLLGHAEATLAGNPALLYAMPQALPSEFDLALHPPLAPAPYIPLELPELPLSMRLRAAQDANAAPAIQPAADLDELRTLADAGAYEAAERLCADLIRREPMSAQLHFYDAILRQVSDDPVGAEAALKRSLYLDRGFVLAHHRLGMLLLARGRIAEARRSLQTASHLVNAVPANDLLPEGQGLSAGALADALRDQLTALGAAA